MNLFDNNKFFVLDNFHKIVDGIASMDTDMRNVTIKDIYLASACKLMMKDIHKGEKSKVKLEKRLHIARRSLKK